MKEPLKMSSEMSSEKLENEAFSPAAYSTQGTR